MLTSILACIGLGLATAVWRYFDGSDKRPKGSNVIAWGLALLATFYPQVIQTLQASSVVLPSILQMAEQVALAGFLGWYLTKGMPGFDQWLPHTNASGKKKPGALLGFGLPTFVAAGLLAAVQPPSLMLVPFAASGLIVASTYLGVLNKLPFLKSFESEILGRFSHGVVVAAASATMFF